MPNFKSKTIRGQGLVEYGLIVTQGATASILALAAPGIGLESIYCSAIEGLGGEDVALSQSIGISSGGIGQ